MDSEALTAEASALPTDREVLGTVKWFSRMKGWGFVEPDGGDRDVFVHYESIVGEGFRNLETGQRVRFRIQDTPKGPKALEVRPLLDASSDF